MCCYQNPGDINQRGSPSSWLHTDALIYRNGKRTLLNIIEGNWRA